MTSSVMRTEYIYMEKLSDSTHNSENSLMDITRILRAHLTHKTPVLAHYLKFLLGCTHYLNQWFYVTHYLKKYYSHDTPNARGKSVFICTHQIDNVRSYVLTKQVIVHHLVTVVILMSDQCPITRNSVF